MHAPSLDHWFLRFLLRTSDRQEKEEYEAMMAERFTTFSFQNPLPRAQRRVDVQHCGKCCAMFFRG